jgi:hypothetical protein
LIAIFTGYYPTLRFFPSPASSLFRLYPAGTVTTLLSVCILHTLSPWIKYIICYNLVNRNPQIFTWGSF